jgi:signal transduction histidine kinase
MVMLGVAFSLGGIAFSEDLTLEVAKQKVLAAAKLIEEQGSAAFPKLRDPAGEFRFADGKGYIWVHSMSGKMLMHPTKSELVGTNMLLDKDSSGFSYILAMNKLVARYGQGWVVYLWPKPGKKLEETKASFVKLVKRGSDEYVIGCGMYAASAEYVRKTCPGDILFDTTNFTDTE